MRTNWIAAVIPRLSARRLVWINGGLGLLVLVANGAAAILMSRGPEVASAAIAEATLWALTGAVLIAGSLYALRAPSTLQRIVQFQTVAVVLLVAALMIWGVALATSPSGSVRVSWSLGFLTAVGFYAAICIASVVRESWLGQGQAKFLWMIPIACAVVDFLVFGKLMQ